MPWPQPSVLSGDHLPLSCFWRITSPMLWALLVGLSLESSHISLPTVPRQAWELKFHGEGYEIGNEMSMLTEWQLCWWEDCEFVFLESPELLGACPSPAWTLNCRSSSYEPLPNPSNKMLYCFS